MGAGAISVINDYFGRPDILVGAYGGRVGEARKFGCDESTDPLRWSVNGTRTRAH